ncbi:ROK family protein [Allofrancisella guangzhouensis]|uniref:fructokinase n=1 Tax=Allofrancisella guangzhouensis TaxID=594679 RepID=A0A0A8E5M5_9GAMM|nr:ROK family protein [Allofrancisella guangzhouensis]AJC49264.1 fructokinase [Allofrancisella guangzhouensis]MBK2027707.1 ROK family protein [Allofrancisella guangzhouensis]MBK2044879.1 ROK family protein [Allofrancisella guangzhouensis]MBK2046404.1 ROK family protein [Allofrancisella guangzhouensis]
MYLLGIEAGGTKFFTTVGDMQGNVIERYRTDTTTPKQTMTGVLEILRNYQTKYDIKAVGLACFGPIDINIKSKTYGYITNTPKTSWKNFDILSSIKSNYNGSIGFNTDVNAAAICEQLWGAGTTGVSNILYLTIGTGVGGGVICNNQLVQGAMHPEIGHIFVPQNPNDNFNGSCPFHNNCLEGLASGTALKERYNVSSASIIPDDHEAWIFEAEYLSKAIVNYIYAFSPEKVVLGGGVMHKTILFNMIRNNVTKYLDNYLDYPALKDMTEFIVPASFGDNTGVKGSLALALNAYKNGY